MTHLKRQKLLCWIEKSQTRPYNMQHMLPVYVEIVEQHDIQPVYYFTNVHLLFCSTIVCYIQ